MAKVNVIAGLGNLVLNAVMKLKITHQYGEYLLQFITGAVSWFLNPIYFFLSSYFERFFYHILKMLIDADKIIVFPE